MIPYAQHPAHPEWAASIVSTLPERWQKRLFNRWEKTRIDNGYGSVGNRAAAYELLDTVDKLHTVNIPLDASDADVCARAEVLAAQCRELGGVFYEWSLRNAIEGLCRANHVQPPYSKTSTAESEVKRVACPIWWRRQLRKLHAKSVEGAAIEMGYVNKTRDIYVSNESLERRRQQNKRNAAALENTRAINEDGQEFTLAELASKGTANKAIRRGELMTRIAGFERIAVECEHVGLFFTMTAPSRMHKWRTVAHGKVVLNARYDGTNPKEAQAYHSKVWSRIRAKLDRCGFGWYGFRIAEPNHDGTPHWHLLVFFNKAWGGDTTRSALPRVCAIIRRYALVDSGKEAGAKKHRVDFKKMDAAKGTAAGYIAKYVSKNIDGYGIEQDLFGNDIVTVSRRVEAWAATWGIRQFQQIGGAPVTVWRELRRVKELEPDAPAHLVQAHTACNRIELDVWEGSDGKDMQRPVKPPSADGGRSMKSEPSQTSKAADWAEYIRAQGGAMVGRGYRIKLEVEEQEGCGRYGDALAPRPIGVSTRAEVPERYAGIVVRLVTVNFIVKSARHVWEIIRRGGVAFKASVAKPWTRVNNCTRPSLADLKKKFRNDYERNIFSNDAKKFEFVGPVNWSEISKVVKKAANQRDEWDFSRRYDVKGRLIVSF